MYQSYGLQIFSDSSDIYSSKCFLFSPKCTQFVSVWGFAGFAPDPARGTYSVPPYSLAGLAASSWNRERVQRAYSGLPYS